MLGLSGRDAKRMSFLFSIIHNILKNYFHVQSSNCGAHNMFKNKTKRTIIVFQNIFWKMEGREITHIFLWEKKIGEKLIEFIRILSLFRVRVFSLPGIGPKRLCWTNTVHSCCFCFVLFLLFQI